MDMTLWTDASFHPDTGIAVRVENGRSYGRQGQEEWQEIDNVTDLFAPGGDPLSFLAGVKHIQEAETETRQLGGEGGLSLTHTRYTFDIDGPTFGKYIGTEMERSAREEGYIPSAISFSAPEVYASMTGQGELWIDEHGLPQRMVINLHIPARQENGDVEAVIQNDFFDYDLDRVGVATIAPWQKPTTWVANHMPSADQVKSNILPQIAIWSFITLLVLWAFKSWHSSLFYRTTAIFIIGSLLIGPLLEVKHTQAFFR